MTKRLRVFAGPNGSGKSSIEQLVSSRYNIGKFVNADTIECTLRENGLLSFSYFNISVMPSDLTRSLASSGFNQKLDLSTLATHLTLKANTLKLKSQTFPLAYLGAILSELIRNKLLKGNETFTFETVMSHAGKLDFFKEAKRRGFKTYLYFVSTESVDINIGRVQSRVQLGGHDVPKEKIILRYKASLENLASAVKIVDRAYIFDNSSTQTILLAEKKDSKN